MHYQIPKPESHGKTDSQEVQNDHDSNAELSKTSHVETLYCGHVSSDTFPFSLCDNKKKSHIELICLL
jgi:hypothetical protein